MPRDVPPAAKADPLGTLRMHLELILKGVDLAERRERHPSYVMELRDVKAMVEDCQTLVAILESKQS